MITFFAKLGRYLRGRFLTRNTMLPIKVKQLPLKVWFDGKWMDAEQYLRTAEMCGAKTVGEVYGMTVGGGRYAVDLNAPTHPVDEFEAGDWIGFGSDGKLHKVDPPEVVE